MTAHAHGPHHLTTVMTRLLLILCPGLAAAADHAQGTSAPPPGGTDSDSLPPSLPPLQVIGHAESPYQDDDAVGSYDQPRWSATRRFADVRMYVMPAGAFDVEYWLFIDTPSRHDRKEARALGKPAPTATLTQQYEVEMGLGHRLQADIYQVYVKHGSNATTTLDATKLELRYALANWGRIWANPTLYAEWIQSAHGADQAEFKLLLSDQITDGWYWASNLVYQIETGNQRERSHEWNSGISYALHDHLISVGAEDHIGLVTDRSPDAAGGFVHHRDRHWEILVGPSLRVTPTTHAYIDLTVYAGCTARSPSTETVLIAGWDF